MAFTLKSAGGQVIYASCSYTEAGAEGAVGSTHPPGNSPSLLSGRWYHGYNENIKKP